MTEPHNISKIEFVTRFTRLTERHCEGCQEYTCKDCQTAGEINFIIRQRALTKIRERKAEAVCQDAA